MRIFFVLVLVGLLSGCSRAVLDKPERAMRMVSAPKLSDTLSPQSLIDALDREVAFLEKKPAGSELKFGPRVITREVYLESLRELRGVLATQNSDDAGNWIKEHFDFYEVYGDKKWGDVFVTGYFEPKIPGSPTPTEQFTQPLYAKPDDLLRVRLEKFGLQVELPRELRARVDNGAVVPYFSRAEIDQNEKLKGRNLELCWVDPIDSFFMQIQGSGVVVLPDGREMNLIYADKNGQPYEAIGKFVREKIAPEPVTLFSLEKYLHSLSPTERQELMNLNPSYVFFKNHEEGAVTYLGVRASAGRTIATDKRYFPKGALAFLEMGDASRFVLDQDIGGAITGAGRVDLFTGSGKEGRELAGALKARGRLMYLVPR